jgi:hypothetical protein
MNATATHTRRTAHHSIRRLVGLVSLVAAATATALAMTAAPAGAVTVRDHGCRGTTEIVPTAGMGSVFPRLIFPWYNIARSGCYSNSTQVITVSQQTYAWSSTGFSQRWAFMPKMSRTVSWRVAPGQHVRVPQFTALDGDEMGMSFTTREYVTWRTLSGTLIGSRLIDHDETTNVDYECTQDAAWEYCMIQVIGGRGAITLWSS